MGAYGTSTDVTVHLDGRPTEVVVTITLSDGTRIKDEDLTADAVATWRAILVRIGLPIQP